ncbi:sialate O-acetylesterase [Stieleria tagensis]|uniref:sialate O-acetylesterase n=1 Tax=Stieleria tagensis TaxID=2956795 RepID=UPI00209B904F|nr:sialate O-acetylesterase [Stieleria tagensis]
MTPSQQRVSAAEPGTKPLKVFILAGQSNMQGHAQVRTMDAMRLNPKGAALLTEMHHPDGTPRVCQDVGISSIGSAHQEQTGRLTVGFGASANGPKIGPEFTFGIWMQKWLDEPVLIIKTAWGGKSLHTDFRPPSAKPYEFTSTQIETFRKQNKDVEQIKADKIEATGKNYRQMVDHVKHVLSDIKRVYPDYSVGQGFELAGFVWFQGWNDMVDRGTYPDRDQPGGFDQYSELLTQFIRDVRRDLSAPEMPFVIGVMGVGGPTQDYGPDQQRHKATHQHFRDAMAAPAELPEFSDNVVTVLTEVYWDKEVAELRRRENAIKPMIDMIKQSMKRSEISRSEGQEKIDRLYNETFSPRERELLQKSTSNFDFHYMGSAGIMAQIGKAFAEALQ